jgi:hypothetical protein
MVLPAEPLYVVTACNPNGTLVSDQRNKALHQELLRHIERFLPFVTNQWEVVGMSKDGQWKERSVALEGIGLKDACAIARAFEQLAFFRLGKETMEVVDAGGVVVKSRPRGL